MRIHELAKELEVTSKDVVEECKRRRLAVKNHMSSLSDPDVRAIREHFLRSSKASAEAGGASVPVAADSGARSGSNGHGDSRASSERRLVERPQTERPQTERQHVERQSNDRRAQEGDERQRQRTVDEQRRRDAEDQRRRDSEQARRTAEETKQRQLDVKKQREAEVLGVLNQQREDIQKRQADESRMLEEARIRRQRELEEQAAADRARQSEIKASQIDRATEIAEQALRQREAASAAAAAAMRDELALLEKARQLRAEKERKAREDAQRREEEARQPRPAEPAGGPRRPGDRPGYQPGQSGRPGGDRPGGDRPGGGPSRPGDRFRPSQVYRVNDVVGRRGDSPAGVPGGRSGDAPGVNRGDQRDSRGGLGGRTGGPAASGRPGAAPASDALSSGKPSRNAPTRGGRPERDRNRDTVREARDARNERSDPLDGRIRSRRYQNSARPVVTQIQVRGAISTRELAELLGVPPAEVIRAGFEMGEMISINSQINEELLLLICDKFGVELELTPDSDETDIDAIIVDPDPEETLEPRSPVITVMGHVDHGKTSLLDRLRKTAVVEGEAGGITQHIGAYQVQTPRGLLTFLDTPGHAAFTAMRQRGARVTDIVILVVAATEGVQPQTVEALNHAKAAKVPIIVAINKMDLPGADPLRVKQELMRYELVAEELGGDILTVPISAKHGMGMDELLEAIGLQAELLNLKANPNRNAIGIVVESHIDPNRGAVATILVQRGTLRHGDCFVVGDQHGRIRAMFNDRGQPVEVAGPSVPVEILGLSGSPEPGEQFVVLLDEREAREIAERRRDRRRDRDLIARQTHVTLENLHERMAEGNIKELNLIIKGDVQGSVEAIVGSITKLESPKIRMRVLHSGVGGINENDVQLADVSDAIVIGFNVRAETGASQMAEERGVSIKLYEIIYNLLDDIKAAMEGMLEPTYEHVATGTLLVQQVFRLSKGISVAGCVVRDGEIHRNNRIKLYRHNALVYDGEILSLKRLKDDVASVRKGLECGVAIRDYNDIKEGDILEPYKIKAVAGVL
mgnify:CR=1 FL=1